MESQKLPSLVCEMVCFYRTAEKSMCMLVRNQPGDQQLQVILRGTWYASPEDTRALTWL